MLTRNLMKLFGLLAAIMLLAAARDGLAADSDGQYAIYGDKGCWDFIVWIDTGNTVQMEKYIAWVSGYVTAYNSQTPDTMTILGGEDLTAAMVWLSKWCHANPKSKMEAAMQALTREFYPRRYRSIKEATK